VVRKRWFRRPSDHAQTAQYDFHVENERRTSDCTSYSTRGTHTKHVQVLDCTYVTRFDSFGGCKDLASYMLASAARREWLRHEKAPTGNNGATFVGALDNSSMINSPWR
jgi:hypothetical protein